MSMESAAIWKINELHYDKPGTYASEMAEMPIENGDLFTASLMLLSFSIYLHS